MLNKSKKIIISLNNIKKCKERIKQHKKIITASKKTLTYLPDLIKEYEMFIDYDLRSIQIFKSHLKILNKMENKK